MNKDLTVTTNQSIERPLDIVWEALVDPDIVRQYFFGTNMTTDWKIGSPIIFDGEWEGKKYRDKGRILDFNPFKLIRYTFWSPLSGLDETDENYSIVTYELGQEGTTTTLSVSQQGFAGEEAREHARAGWGTVLSEMKKLLEK